MLKLLNILLIQTDSMVEEVLKEVCWQIHEPDIPPCQKWSTLKLQFFDKDFSAIKRKSVQQESRN